MNETFINDSSFNINIDESLTKLLWNFPELKIDQKVTPYLKNIKLLLIPLFLQLEEKIAQIICNLVSIKEFSIREYKVKMLDLLKTLNKKVIKILLSLTEFLQDPERHR